MSEILIKNMALPKQGWKRLILLPDGEVREICGDEAVRATDSRAVELPEHGRLGDLDKTRKQIEDSIETVAKSKGFVDGGELWKIVNKCFSFHRKRSTNKV